MPRNKDILSERAYVRTFVEMITERLIDAIDYYCENVSKDPYPKCVLDLLKMDLIGLAEKFVDWEHEGFYSDIRKEDIIELRMLSRSTRYRILRRIREALGAEKYFYRW
jgi:hypothetical protein